MNMKGKVMVITGGGSGIGAATSQLLAAQRAAVIVADLNLDHAGRTVELIKEDGGLAIAVAHDVRDPAQSERLVKFAIDEFGGLHGAVNNAGVPASGTRLEEERLEVWDQVIAVNLSGVFYGMRAQLPAIASSGGGAIVNVSSVMGALAAAGSSAYTAAKHGVVGLTRAAAIENGARGIRVNAVGPGYIQTPMLLKRQLSSDLRDAKVAMHPIGRFGQPVEVAEFITFLLSDAASFVTGGFYPVDGGFSAQ